jgi:hypothetical protein
MRAAQARLAILGGDGPHVAVADACPRSFIVGACTEAQLRENLGAVAWTQALEQMATLDAASDVTPAYPYWPYRHQQGFAMRNPPTA